MKTFVVTLLTHSLMKVEAHSYDLRDGVATFDTGLVVPYVLRVEELQ